MDSFQISGIANDLHISISGCTIDYIWMAEWYRKRAEKNPEYNINELRGWTFTSVIRVGKSLLFRLENPGIGNRYIANRLGLSGVWSVRSVADGYYSGDPNAAFVFGLVHSQGKIFLAYYDSRRSGSLEVRSNEGDLESLRSYGPEIRSNQFTREWVTFFVKRHAVPIKQILLRPEYCPGISNWVASEVLFLANINPMALGSRLKNDQIKRLFEALHICVNGHTTNMVWDRADKKCLLCHSVIKKIQINRRGTFFCPYCQSVDWQIPKPITKEYVEKIVQGKL